MPGFPGGQPNTWYHDGLPYTGTDPVPDGGCLTACSVSNATQCPAQPHIQVFDVIQDEASVSFSHLRDLGVRYTTMCGSGWISMLAQ